MRWSPAGMGRMTPREFAIQPRVGRSASVTARRHACRVALLILGAALALDAEPSRFSSLSPKVDVREHWIIEGSAPGTWTVKDGVIVCSGKPNGFLRSKRSYRNFVFRAEWRFQKKGWTKKPPSYPNAGYFIHAGRVERDWPKSLEVQGHYGEAGSLFGVRGGRVVGAHRGPTPENRRPFGEWESVEIESLDGVVTVRLNGKKMNEGRDIEPREGNICLQSEGWPVYYRNLAVKDLD